MLTQRQMDFPPSRGETGQRSQSSPSQVLGLATGFWVSQALYVAAKAGIADLLADGPKPVEALARKRSCILGRSIGSCVCSQVLECLPKATRVVSTTRKRPNFLRPANRARFGLSSSCSESRSAGDHGEYSCTAYRRANPRSITCLECPFFIIGQLTPGEPRIFDNAMASRSAAETAAVLAVYDLSDAKHTTDIGGGAGKNIACRHPRRLPATGRQTVRLALRYRARAYRSDRYDCAPNG